MKRKTKAELIGLLKFASASPKPVRMFEDGKWIVIDAKAIQKQLDTLKKKGV